MKSKKKSKNQTTFTNKKKNFNEEFLNLRFSLLLRLLVGVSARHTHTLWLLRLIARVIDLLCSERRMLIGSMRIRVSEAQVQCWFSGGPSCARAHSFS